jgi:hypothetical protein
MKRILTTHNLRFATPGTWQFVRDEARELAWLASIVAILSIGGVALAVSLVLTLEG